MSGSGHDRISKILAYYEFGALSEEMRRAVENHALECDECFAELERGSVPAAAMRGNRQETLEILREIIASPAPRPRTKPGFLSEWAQAWRRWPRMAVAATTVVLLVAIGLFGHGDRPDPRQLASFPPEDAAATAVRASGASDAARELMQAGGAYFNLREYDEAERRFLAALDHDPDLAEGAYLLGLSRIHRGRLEEAIAPLQRAADLAGGDLRPRVVWTLANVHLKLGAFDRATRVLAPLAEDEGEYAVRARDLLRRIPP